MNGGVEQSSDDGVLLKEWCEKRPRAKTVEKAATAVKASRNTVTAVKMIALDTND